MPPMVGKLLSHVEFGRSHEIFRVRSMLQEVYLSDMQDTSTEHVDIDLLRR